MIIYYYCKNYVNSMLACILGKTSPVGTRCFCSSDLLTLARQPCVQSSDVAALVTHPRGIQFKLVVLFHRVLYGNAPKFLKSGSYVTEVCTIQSSSRPASSSLDCWYKSVSGAFETVCQLTLCLSTVCQSFVSHLKDYLFCHSYADAVQ